MNAPPTQWPVLVMKVQYRQKILTYKEKANGTTRNRCPERCPHRHWNLWWKLEGQTPYRVRGSRGPRGRQAGHDQPGRGGTRGVRQRDPYRYSRYLSGTGRGGVRRPFGPKSRRQASTPVLE